MAQHKLILPLIALALASPALGASATPAAPVAAAAPIPPVEQLLIKRNYKAAFDALLKEATAGDPKAMVKLATAYRYGLGTAASDGAAQAWYAKAAAAGNKEASLALQRQQVSVPPTVKKVASATGGGAAPDGVDFSNLPERPKDGADWASLAAAQGNHAALKALAGTADGQVQLVLAAVGDGEGLKDLAPAPAQDALGRTPLMVAVAYHRMDALSAVLAAKPDFAVLDKQGFSAASLAAQACDADVLQHLAASGDDLKSGRMPPIVAAAASCSDWSKLSAVFSKADVNAADAQGRSAAFYAAASGNLELLAWLSAQGADLKLADAEGFSPLHLAAQRGQAEAVRFLLGKLEKNSFESKRNVTPLMLAANSGCVPCIAALLDLKPDLDQKDDDGDTALMFAVRALQGKAAQKLADSGANPNAKNTAGDTPLKLGLRLGLTQIKAAN